MSCDPSARLVRLFWTVATNYEGRTCLHTGKLLLELTKLVFSSFTWAKNVRECVRDWSAARSLISIVTKHVRCTFACQESTGPRLSLLLSYYLSYFRRLIYIRNPRFCHSPEISAENRLKVSLAWSRMPATLPRRPLRLNDFAAHAVDLDPTARGEWENEMKRVNRQKDLVAATYNCYGWMRICHR